MVSEKMKKALGLKDDADKNDVRMRVAQEVDREMAEAFGAERVNEMAFIQTFTLEAAILFTKAISDNCTKHGLDMRYMTGFVFSQVMCQLVNDHTPDGKVIMVGVDDGKRCFEITEAAAARIGAATVPEINQRLADGDEEMSQRIANGEVEPSKDEFNQ